MATKSTNGGDGTGDPQGGGLPAVESYPGLTGHLEVDTDAQFRGAAFLEEIAGTIVGFASSNNGIVTYKPLIGDADDTWEKFEPGYVEGATAFQDFINTLATAGKTLTESVLLYAQVCAGTEDAAQQIGFGALLFNNKGDAGDDEKPLPRPKPYLGGPDPGPQPVRDEEQPRMSRAMLVRTTRDAVPAELGSEPGELVRAELNARPASLMSVVTLPDREPGEVLPARLGSEPGEVVPAKLGTRLAAPVLATTLPDAEPRGFVPAELGTEPLELGQVQTGTPASRDQGLPATFVSGQELPSVPGEVVVVEEPRRS
ncbi:hypothetical protein [Lentzea sp. CA-135723]|uniref:hypothetical protein n=1 Tax=Lentzea sp. CA-135723 TaxID=3239950 RepID=UPI003D904658